MSYGLLARLHTKLQADLAEIFTERLDLAQRKGNKILVAIQIGTWIYKTKFSDFLALLYK